MQARFRHILALAALTTLAGWASAPALAQETAPAAVCPAPAAPDLTLAQTGRSGSPLALRWSDPWPAMADDPGCADPRYLVLALPEATRLAGAGAGMLILAPDEAGPPGLVWGADRLRLVVPLNAAAGAPQGPRGTASLLPYVIGRYAADWALVRLGPGPQIAASGRLEADLLPGTPALVVADPADPEPPGARILSPDGSLLLEVFAGHYRLRDRATGETVLKAEGLEPRFSPTGRFLHAFRSESLAGAQGQDWLYGDLQVHDLLSGDEVYAIRQAGGASRGTFITGLLWSPGDSYLAVIFEAQGALLVKPMLSGAPAQGDEYSCGACSPWDEGVIRINAEGAGQLVTGAAWGGEASSIYRPGRVTEVAGQAEGAAGPVFEMLGVPRASWLDEGRAGAPGVPALVAPLVLDAADPAAPGLAIAVTSRAAVPIGGEEEALQQPARARMVQRLEEMGLGLVPALALDHRRIPSEAARFWAAQEADAAADPDVEPEDDVEEPADWRIEGGYYFDTGRAALEAGLADPAEAEALTVLALGAMDSPWCQVSRAEAADLWTWRGAGGRLGQILHIQCRTGSGYSPEGVLYLIRPATGTAPALLVELAGGWGGEDPEEQPSALAPPGGAFPLAAHARLWVGRLGPDRIALAGIDGRAVVFDARSAAVERALHDLPAPDQILSLGLTQTGGHLFQQQADGQFHVFAAVDGARLLDGVYLDDEVVISDRALRYDATPEGASYLAARFPGDRGLYSLDQLGAEMRVPGMAAAVLEAGQAAPAGGLAVTRLPPRLALLQGEDGTARVEASAPAGLTAITLYRDGVAVGRIAAPAEGGGLTLAAGDPLALAASAGVALPPGTRWLSLRAEDAAGGTSRLLSLPLAPAPAPTGRLHVLALGVDGFSDPRLPGLRYAASDAARFAAAVEAALTRPGAPPRYAGVSVTLIDPAEDPRRALPDKLAALGPLRPEDTLVLFVATHGLPGKDGRYYLAGPQTRIADLPGTALDLADLAAALAPIQARAFLFLDACHSGGTPGSNDAAFAGLQGAEARIAVIAASKGRQPSLEGAALGGGAFTSALIRALRDPAADADGNGALELVELYAAVKADVVRATGGRQTPWIARSGFQGEVPLF